MIPSVNLVLASVWPRAGQACLAVLTSFTIAYHAVNADQPSLWIDAARVLVAAAGAHLYIYLVDEWKAFDERMAEEGGSYIPIDIQSKKAADEKIVTEDEQSAVQAVLPRRSSFSEKDMALWRTVLATGTPFKQVSRRHLLVEPS